MAKHVRIRFFMACALLGAPALSACSSNKSPEQEQRLRALLTPPDTQREREERERKTRLFDEEGNLLESEQSVVGLVMPRGFSPATKFEHQWRLKADHVPPDALLRYFEARLDGYKISRSADGSLVILTGVRPPGDDKAAPLTLQITQLKDAPEASELYVREPLPASRRLSAGEAEAQLKALREHAE